ncbi:uncharacterized protein LOC143923701 [Lithobates pipiens]
MESARLIFLLLLHRSYSALDVLAPGIHNAVIGSTTLVPCSFTVDSPPINPKFLAILWQHGEKELVRYDNKEKSDSPRMFIDEKEAKQGNASLTINNVTLADQGTYKCLIIYSPVKEMKEIQVDIQALPEVTLMKKALSKSGKNRLLCLITNFYPKDISVTWLRNGQTLEGSELGPFQKDADGTYRVNSSLIISPTQSQDHPIITCQVDHVSLPEVIRDNLTMQYGVEPEITLFSSRDGDKEIVVCELKSFYPDTSKISWLLEGKRIEPSRKNADGTYNDGDHFLILGNQKRPKNISCVVEHETSYTPFIRTLTLTEEKYSSVVFPILITGLICVVVSALSFFIYKNKYFQRFQLSNICVADEWTNKSEEKVTMYCMAFHCPRQIRVTWTVLENSGNKVTVEDHRAPSNEEREQLLSDYEVRTGQSQTDGLYNAVTSLTFTPTASRDHNMTITCSFLCDGKTRKKSVKWSLISDSCPKLDDIIVPFLVHGREAKLQCVIRKYFPDNLEVKWFRRDADRPEMYEVSSGDKYKILGMEVTQDLDRKYSCTASLIVTISAKTDQGSEFICRVKHPSMDTYLEKCTGELKVAGIPVINSSVQDDKFIELEVDGVYKDDPVLTWEGANNENGPYKKIEDKNIKTTKSENSDGSFKILSKCDISYVLYHLKDRYFKATVEHSALKSPEEIIFYNKGGIMKLFNKEKILLAQVPKKITKSNDDLKSMDDRVNPVG